MTTSSAEPARLRRYPDDLTAADRELATLATDLNTAMDDFAAGAGAFKPAGFDAGWTGNFVQNLHDESVYLGHWVKSVGDGFAAVGTDANGDGIFDVEDGVLAPLVGKDTRRAPAIGRTISISAMDGNANRSQMRTEHGPELAKTLRRRRPV